VRDRTPLWSSPTCGCSGSAAQRDCWHAARCMACSSSYVMATCPPTAAVCLRSCAPTAAAIALSDRANTTSHARLNAAASNADSVRGSPRSLYTNTHTHTPAPTQSLVLGLRQLKQRR
jgi:hypothetical protein